MYSMRDIDAYWMNCECMQAHHTPPPQWGPRAPVVVLPALIKSRPLFMKACVHMCGFDSCVLPDKGGCLTACLVLTSHPSVS